MGKSGGRRSSISSLKGQTAVLGLEDTFSPGKEKDWKGKKGKKEKKGGGRLHYERCAHCQELYSEVIKKSFFKISLNIFLSAMLGTLITFSWGF